MGYNYRYTVTFWNESEGCEMIETGFVCGDNYADATSKLATMYGEDYIKMVSIAYHSEFGGVIIDNDWSLGDEPIKAHAEKFIKPAGGITNAQ